MPAEEIILEVVREAEEVLRETNRAVGGKDSDIGFCFPGQGSQYVVWQELARKI